MVHRYNLRTLAQRIGRREIPSSNTGSQSDPIVIVEGGNHVIDSSPFDTIPSDGEVLNNAIIHAELLESTRLHMLRLAADTAELVESTRLQVLRMAEDTDSDEDIDMDNYDELLDLDRHTLNDEEKEKARIMFGTGVKITKYIKDHCIHYHDLYKFWKYTLAELPYSTEAILNYHENKDSIPQGTSDFASIIYS